VKTLPFLNELISFLPDRGFFQSFTLNQDHTINLSIQFDTETDAAYYLSRLSNSSWFSEAKLLSLTTQDITAASNSVTGTDSTQSGTQTNTDTENQDVLPRYLASYQVTLNPSAVQAGETKQAGGANP
jgi:type IV pilus assembly protein PilN